MKISQLRQIIKEEIEKSLNEFDSNDWDESESDFNDESTDYSSYIYSMSDDKNYIELIEIISTRIDKLEESGKLETLDNTEIFNRISRIYDVKVLIEDLIEDYSNGDNLDEDKLLEAIIETCL